MRDKVRPPCFLGPFIFLRQVLLANIPGIMCTRDANVDPCPAACPALPAPYLARVYTRARVAPTFLDIMLPFVSGK